MPSPTPRRTTRSCGCMPRGPRAASSTGHRRGPSGPADRTPSVPGHELSRVVAELEYGTTGLTVRQRVFGLVNWAHNGSLAEYVALETRDLAPLPADADHAMAAALPISGLTAWRDRAQARRAAFVDLAADRLEDVGAVDRRVRRPRQRDPRSLDAAGPRRRHAGHRRRPAVRPRSQAIDDARQDDHWRHRGSRMRITIRLALIAVSVRCARTANRTKLRFAGPPPAVRHRP